MLVLLCVLLVLVPSLSGGQHQHEVLLEHRRQIASTEPVFDRINHDGEPLCLRPLADLLHKLRRVFAVHTGGLEDEGHESSVLHVLGMFGHS